MSFHTVELSMQLDSMTFWAFFDALVKVTSKLDSASIYDTKSGAIRCTLLDDLGIKITLRKRSEEFHKDMVYIVFNPQRLIEEREFLKITKTDDYMLINRLFKKIFEPIQKAFTSKRKNKYLKFDFDVLNAYQVRRFDPCVNVHTEYKDWYLELLKRANKPNKYELGMKYDPISRRLRPYDDAFRLESKSVVFFIYDKYSQLKRREPDYEDIEQARNIIRIEVQCKKNKTNYMKYSQGWSNKSLTHFSDEEMCKNTIMFYYKKVVGLGDYYTLAEARSKILDNNKLSEKIKMDMLEVLELVNEKRGVWKARPYYNGKDFDKILARLNKEGINAVTIPAHFGIRHLPNLVHEIMKEFMPQ